MPPYLPAFATLIAALFGGWLLIRVHAKNAHRAAAVKFRAAFSVAIATIEAASRHNGFGPDRPDVSKVLREGFIAHAAAIEEFRPFVGSKDRQAYERAWSQYRELAYDEYNVGAEFLAENLTEASPLTLLRNRIHAFLKFAET